MIEPEILILQEERLLSNYLRDFLNRSSYRCITAANYEDGLIIIDTQNPDIVVADMHTSASSCWQFIRLVRTFSKIPIIILSEITDARCIIHSLEIGADDYVKKPFNPTELHARIQAILRRSNGQGLYVREILSDYITGSVERFDEKIPQKNLSRLEVILLNYLVRNEGHVLSNEEILTSIWGNEYKNDHQLLRTAVARLRKKMNTYPLGRRSIRNIPRVGYLFESRSEPADSLK